MSNRKRCPYADRTVSTVQQVPGITRAEALKIIHQAYNMFEQRRATDPDYKLITSWQQRMMRTVHEARNMWQQYEPGHQCAAWSEAPVDQLRADAAYAIYGPAEKILVTAINDLAGHADLVIGWGPQPGARGFNTELHRRAKVLLAKHRERDKRDRMAAKQGTVMRNGKVYFPTVPEDDPVLTNEWKP